MVLFRILINLFGLATRLLWLPILLISRNLFLVILVVIALILYVKFENGKTPEQLTPGQSISQPTRAAVANNNNQLPSVDPVLRREDGNSAFSADLYANMTNDERNLYSGFFFWAMDNLKDGQTYPWQAGNIASTITVQNSFLNKSRVTCRRFVEVLKVHTIEQQLGGVACPRDRQSWCKLKPNSTPSCGLGGKPGFWQSLKNLF